jgi:hypothetical protein
MCERILIVAPANLAFQWQRELKEKFEAKFLVIKGDDIRDLFGVNQWLEQKQLVTSLDLAKRTEILPGLRQVQWDLIIVDEAHRMSWSPPARKTARYALGELLRDISDHMLLLTATPHKGDPANSACSCSCSTPTPMPTFARSARRWTAAVPRSTSGEPRRRWFTSPNANPTAHGSPRKSSPSASRTPLTSRSTERNSTSTRP